jgi:hypothetical protein
MTEPGGNEAEMRNYASRRSLLKAGGAAMLSMLALPIRSDAAAAPPPATSPANRFYTDGGLVILPDKGQLFVANDFHTHHADFQRWLKRSDLIARLKDNPDVYGLVLGDVADQKPADPEVEADGDSRIVDKIREIQHGPGGDRLIYVLGNHEYEVARIYDAMKKQLGLNAANRKRIIAALYKSPDGAFFQQHNFIERINDEQFEYIKDLPIGVLGQNGVVYLHAGPARKATSKQPLRKKEPETVVEVVWGRPITNYDADDVDRFLKMMDDSHLLIVGHTPLPSLPDNWIHHGLCFIGQHAAVMAASYGAMPGQKQYLVIDLAKRYGGVDDLAPEKEIRAMEEKQARVVGSLPALASAGAAGWPVQRPLQLASALERGIT